MSSGTNRESKAVLAILLAGVLWGIICIFINGLSAAGFVSMDIVFVRMLAASIIFVIFILFKDPSALKIHIRDIWMFIGMGIVSITLFNYCYFQTTIESGTSVAVVLLYTSPIFIMLMSAVLFKEKITGIKLIALAATFAGCVLTAGIVGNGMRLTARGLLIGVLAGFFHALYTVFGRVALKKYDSVTVTVWAFICGLIGSVFFTDVPHVFAIIASNSSTIWNIIGIAVLSTILPYLLYTWGLNYVEPGKAGIIVAIEPVVGAVLGMTIYGEPHNIEKIIGLVLVVAAIVILNIPQKDTSH